MIAKFLALYLALSMAASAAYNTCPQHDFLFHHRFIGEFMSVENYRGEATSLPFCGNSTIITADSDCKGGEGMSSNAWKKEHTTQFNLRFTNSSGIPIAIAKAAEKQEVAPVEYIKAVLRKQLISDGYLSPDPQSDGE